MDVSDLELDDYSFPEIELDVWEQIQDKEDQHKVASGNNSVKEEVDTEIKVDNVGSLGKALDGHFACEDEHAASKIHADLGEEDKESEKADSIWETFSEIADADWQALDPPQTFETPSESIIYTPIYFLLDLAPYYEASGDIEDLHMAGRTLNEAGNLLKKYKRSGGLSVSNITAPLWCQQKIFYDLAGLQKLGAEKRPTEFKVERKVIVDNKPVIKQVVIKPDKAVLKKREEDATRGKTIHRKLELDIAPERVHIPTKTKEEHFALKILEMLTGLKTLSTSRLWREFPVFGFIEGIPVNGVIDELQLVPASRGNALKVSDTKTKPIGTTSFDVSDGHRLQLMIYKHLLDGMLSSNFEWNRTFKLHRLGPELAFSDDFLAQLLALSEDNQLGELVSSCRNLRDLTSAWLDGVQALDIPKGKCDLQLSVVFRSLVDVRARERRRARFKPHSHLSSASPIEGESEIMDIQTFAFEKGEMMDSVRKMMGFWLGTRPITGVSPDEAWKCNACEYKEDCEWRQEQADLLSQKRRRG